ncbi:MAG: BspA family leucine-rich repeat surface protein, partial [Proteobacteria bacterium]|nr:BspA family leucine-rich repeat surface protein [Pseudomonadota bacterium]
INDNIYLYSHFNQPINEWDVKNVRRMSDMFLNAKYFDQNLDDWNDKLSNVTTMSNMFRGAINFYQNLSNWRVSSKEHIDMLKNSAMEHNCSYWPLDIQNSCN